MEKVCSLKWRNHNFAFMQLLNNLRKQQMYTDVVLACSGKFYNAHRMILAACSDYFNQIFEHVDSNKPVVVLNDVKCTDLEALLDYMYLGEANVMPSEVPSIIHAAENMEIKGLTVDEDEVDKIVNNAPKSSKRKLGSNQHLNNDFCSRNKSKVLKKPKLSSLSMENCPQISEHILEPHTEPHPNEDQCQEAIFTHTFEDEGILPAEIYTDDPLTLNEAEPIDNNCYGPDYTEQASSSLIAENTLEDESDATGSLYQPYPECEYNAPSVNYSFKSEEQSPPDMDDPHKSMEIIQLRVNKRARTYLIRDDHIYLINSQRGNVAYLTCISKRVKNNSACQALATGTVVLVGSEISSVKNFTLNKEHNHDPCKSRVDSLRLRRSCFERASFEDVSCQQIFNEEKERFPEAAVNYAQVSRIMAKFWGQRVRQAELHSDASQHQ